MIELAGASVVPATRERAFALLVDPLVLQRCIPGCEKLVAAGEFAYDAVLKVGVGAIKGSFGAKITLGDVRPPEGYRLVIEAKSPAGLVHGAASLALVEDGPERCRLTYEGSARVSGLMAAIGQRLLGAAAQKLAAEFFERLAGECKIG